MASALVPVGPGVPASVAAILKSHESAILQLREPAAPTRVYALAAADLPPAADWPEHVVWVSDIPTLAQSDGTNWIRADTGAAI